MPPKRTATQREEAEEDVVMQDAQESKEQEPAAAAASAEDGKNSNSSQLATSFSIPPPGDPAKAIRDKKAIEGLVEGMGSKANEIVHEILPAKILALDRLYQKHLNQQAEAFRPTVDGALPNQQIRDALEEIKRETRDMIGHMDTLKIFVLLNIPTIEDQKDLSVAVKEEFAEMLSAGRQSVISVTNSISKYYATRGKLVSKTLKYPDIPDFRASIDELDEKQYHAMVVIIADLRNNYAVIYDFFVKNIRSISKPPEIQDQLHSILY